MPIEFTCPRCQTAIQVPDETAGKKGRCPNCQGKVRVPTPPLPEIEFHCPQCTLAIRVPGESAGKKVRCPQCQTKLRVPAVAPPPPPVETFAAAPPKPAPVVDDHVVSSDTSVPNLAPAINLGGAEATTISKAIRLRQKSNLGKLLVPMLCLSTLTAAGAWFFWKGTPKLEGTLVAERIPDTELPPVIIDPTYLNLPRNKLRDLFETMAADPLRVKGELMRLEIRGGKMAIEIIPEVGTNTVFYRIDLKQNKFLWKYATAHRDEFDKPRQKELASSVPEFVQRVDQRRRGAATADSLFEFRNSVGVNSMVRGLGYQLQAEHRGEGHRCVYEDSDGRLYFLLPRNLTSFELSGRKPATKGDLQFPGHYEVTVTAAKAASSSAPKSKK